MFLVKKIKSSLLVTLSACALVVIACSGTSGGGSAAMPPVMPAPAPAPTVEMPPTVPPPNMETQEPPAPTPSMPEPVTVNLSVGSSIGGGVTNDQTDCFDGCVLPVGRSVTLLANPLNGYQFDGWTCRGSCSGIQNSPRVTVVVNENTTITAQFVDLQVTLTVSSDNRGTVQTTPSSCSSGTCNLNMGQRVMLTASPSSFRYGFERWACTGSCQGLGDSGSTSVVINSDTSITAYFEEIDDHGNSIEEATSIRLDSPVRGEINPGIGFIGDSDFFRVNVPREGKLGFNITDGIGNDRFMQIVVYSANGNEVHSGFVGNFVSETNVSAGVYYISLRNHSILQVPDNRYIFQVSLSDIEPTYTASDFSFGGLQQGLLTQFRNEGVDPYQLTDAQLDAFKIALSSAFLTIREVIVLISDSEWEDNRHEAVALNEPLFYTVFANGQQVGTNRSIFPNLSRQSAIAFVDAYVEAVNETLDSFK